MKVAVILSGCGYLDGAEIRESVLSLLYLDQQGAEVSIFAPDINQHHVLNHLNGQEQAETRNIRVESARIARGKVSDLATLNASDFDGLVIPGGFGVAKNLSDLAFKGSDATVNPDFSAAIRAFFDAKKPIGAICIAPAVLAAVLKNEGVSLTIGDDEGTAGAIEAFGNKHHNCATNNSVSDENNAVFSCSAYMRDDVTISDVATGIEQVVTAVIARINSKNVSAA